MCKNVQPVPAWVEEPVSPVRKLSSGGGVMNDPPFPKMPLTQPVKEGYQNWHTIASA